MTPDSLLALLADVERGALTPEAAASRLATLPFEADALGHARIDHHRSLRAGLPEVIYAAGKTPAQAVEIFTRLAASGVAVLATRATPEHFAAIAYAVPGAVHHEVARCISLQPAVPKPHGGRIAVLCAGTSDLPVAEEAAVTAELFGAEVTRLYDVGVAGLQRLLAVLPALREANVVIVCAGMEGALPSVVGGLVAVPVIAVPTSVGYGASFSGVTALLGMLNSCSPNVTVVNIDNGFGAAYAATLIARASSSERPTLISSQPSATSSELQARG